MHKVVKPRQTIAEFNDDSRQHSDDDEAVTDITSLTEYYTTSIPLHAAINTLATFPAPTGASSLPPSTPIEQFRATGVTIIGVVVGVVGMLLGVGLLLGKMRRKRTEIEDHETLSVEKLSYESEDSAYVLQQAHTKSVEIKRGILISIPRS